MKKTAFYVNVANEYKRLEHGYLINDDLAYSRLGDEFAVTHLKTGMNVVTHKTVEGAKELAEKLLIEHSEIVNENIRKFNIDDLPFQEDLYTRQNELCQLLDLEILPIDAIVHGLTGKEVVDIIELDEVLQERGNFDDDLSMGENIAKLYGERAVEPIELLIK